MNGNVTLVSGSLTIDARGLLLNLGGDLYLAGGELKTDNTTNFHLIDNSMLRNGRLDVVLFVQSPDEKSRLDIIKILTDGMPLANNINLNEIGRASCRERV